MKRLLSFLLVIVIAVSLTVMPSSATASASAVNTNYTFRFSAVFSNYMVLQQNQESNIWGYGEPNSSVLVCLVDDLTGTVLEEIWTVSDANGKWEVTFAPREGSFNSYTITAQSAGVTLTLLQVVYGEVWVLGGQSNMEMYLLYTNDVTTVQNQPRNPYIRGYFFYSNDISRYSEILEPNGVWLTAETWDTTPYFSAIGYYFAEKIFDELNVPIGLIHTAIGGSRLTTWVGGDVLENDAQFNQILTNAGITANDSDWDSLSGFYNSKVAPFRGLHVKGMLWYQGESEVMYATQDTVLRYGIPLLNRCWSEVFECDEELLPMITIQLARYDGYSGDNLPKGNEAMALGVEQINMELGGNAIAVPLYDVPETATDLSTDIHPQNKKPVGIRAADAAMGMVYNKQGLYSGPVPLSAKLTSTNTIEVTFGNVGEGLATINSAALNGFTITYGTNDTVITPTMSITGTDKVTLTYSNLANLGVTKVCYAFAVDNTASNLTNSAGFPAVAFRLELTNAPITSVSPQGGVYNEPITVTLSTDVSATTYYTVDGTIPTTSSPVYTAPFVLKDDATVRYFSVNSDGTEKTRLVKYTVNIADAVAPVTTASVKGGVYYSSVSVKLTANEEAEIYYTLDGTTPNENSSVYTGEIIISSNAELKYFAVDSYGNAEQVNTENYIILNGNSQGYGVDVQIDGRDARLYVSGKYNSSYEIPLVVMLHGDGQSAKQFEKLTEMNAVADDKGFIVLYLNADSSNSISSWKWYAPSDDIQYIASAIESIKSRYNIDADKIYAVGFGAGAVMANALAVKRSDLISGVAIASGAQYGAASTLNEAFTAMALGGTSDGSEIVNDMAEKSVVPVIVIHGDNDGVFAPVNADLTVSQWACANDIFDNSEDDGSIYDIPSSTLSGNGYTKYVYNNTNGYTVIEKYVISSMGYAWSGENYKGAYSYQSAVNQSELIYDFFLRTAEFDYTEPAPERDLTAPVTTPSSPSGSYEESVSVMLSVNEEAAIYYTVDGTEPTTSSSVYSVPLTFTSDTVLKFFAVDVNGNVEQVKTCTYTITERTERTFTFNYDAANSGYVSSLPAIFGAGTALQAGLGGYYQGDSIRTIFSFDTSSISSADVSKVVLRLTVSSCDAAVTAVGLDIKNGTFGNLGLENTDFDATADGAGIIAAYSVASGNIDLEIPSDYYSYIGNRIELRVFTAVTNGLSLATINFSQAQLIVTTGTPSVQTFSLRSVYSTDENITFTDSALKNAVINSGVDANGDNEISLTEILDLYALDASSLSINSLAGLEYAENLRYLDVSGNSLSDISPISSLGNLQYLDVSENSLTDISCLSNLDGLLILNVSQNSVSVVPSLSNGITNLCLGANKITDISSVSSLTALSVVDFEDNEVSSLKPIENLSYLFSVNSDRNMLDLTDGGENETIVSSLTANGVLVSVLDQKSTEPEFVGIKSVSSVVEDGKVIFTVKTSAHFNRIKVTTADLLKGYISYRSECDVDSDGLCVYTLTVPAVEGKTTYAFDGRLISTGKYAADYYYYDVTVEETVGTIKSATYEITDGKIIFTVVTKAGEFNRIKVTTADSLNGSLGVANTYTVNADGDYVWTVKATAPTSKTNYAFDLRNGETGKYLKEYFYLEAEPVSAETTPVKSVSYTIDGENIVFTVVTNAGDYSRIKVTTADNLGGSLGVANTYTVNADGDYVWTVKATAPSSTTTYAFDLRNAETGKYLKEYFTFEANPTVSEPTTPVKSVTYTISGDKLTFSVVTEAGDYSRIKVTTADNLGGSLKVAVDYTVNADGDYVWTLKISAPTQTASYAFDLRNAETGKYLKDYFIFDVVL